MSITRRAFTFSGYPRVVSNDKILIDYGRDVCGVFQVAKPEFTWIDEISLLKCLP